MFKRRILTAKEQYELLTPWRKHADDASSHTFADFFQWCAEERLRPNRASLSLYAQTSGMNMEDYLNLSSLLSDMGLDSQYLELLRMSRRMWSMADTTKWHPMIKHKPGWWGSYHISDDDGKEIGSLQYTNRKDLPIYIDALMVHPNHEGQGIGQALVERLHKDFPERKIDPGYVTPKGNGFTQHLRKIIPEANNVLVPDYQPTMLHSEDVDHFDNETSNRFSRRFWAAPAEDAYDPNPHPAHSSPTPKPFRENPSGKWYHVSPHKMEPDTILSPGGGESTYNYNDTTMPRGRQDWVWMDGPESLKTWYYGTLLSQIKNGVENPWAHIYEVEPSEGPHPWNGTGWEGHAAPSARIIREIETDKYNRLPDHLGLKYEQPEGITVSSHPFRKSKGLADEVLQQDGPAILWKALKDRWPGDHHYVARGEDGTIHGVLKGSWSKDKFYLSDLYSSLKAPSGTGNHLLRTVAQDALSQGKGLRVINMLNDARPYWEGMGAQTEYNNAHADWSPESLQALVNGDTIMSPNTEGTMMHNQSIPREHRLPGSARQVAWGRRKQKSAGKNGDLPPGLKFKYYGVHPFTGDNWFEAEHEGKTVGRLFWDHSDHGDGEIGLIQVHPNYRRRGIGTKMVDTVRRGIDPGIQYSSVVTPMGKAWSKANGYTPPEGRGWSDIQPRNDKREWRE